MAGIWQPTIDWGDAYSMVMVDGCEQMSDVHDRMPVILQPDQCDKWSIGSPAEAMEVAQTADCALLCERTDELCLKSRNAEAEGALI